MKIDYVKKFSKAWSNTNNRKRKAAEFLEHTQTTSIYFFKSADLCSMLQ